MDPQFLVARRGVQSGPFSREEVERQIAEGELDAHDLCWTTGMAEWQPVGAAFPVPHAPEPLHLPPPMTPAIPTAEPLFLYISPVRLIVLSILTLGIYEVYWVYKNWQYLKRRNPFYRDIMPFWRGWFGIFYIHSLLRTIHDDPEALAIETPTFTPQVLATVWIVLMIIANALGRLDQAWAGVLAAFMPSFMCLLPVQQYINAVTRKRNPGQPYFGFSPGHIVCILVGCLAWLGIAYTAAQALGIVPPDGGDGGGGTSSGPQVL